MYFKINIQHCDLVVEKVKEHEKSVKKRSQVMQLTMIIRPCTCTCRYKNTEY